MSHGNKTFFHVSYFAGWNDYTHVLRLFINTFFMSQNLYHYQNHQKRVKGKSGSCLRARFSGTDGTFHFLYKLQFCGKPALRGVGVRTFWVHELSETVVSDNDLYTLMDTRVIFDSRNRWKFVRTWTHAESLSWRTRRNGKPCSILSFIGAAGRHLAA